MNQTIKKADNYFLKTYNRYPIVLESGEGVYLYDDAGKKYLDFAAGIGGFGNHMYGLVYLSWYALYFKGIVQVV